MTPSQPEDALQTYQLAQERLSRAEDGHIAYRMKRPLPDGTAHLLFTGLELLRRLARLVPPPRANLTRFHGVFAPGAKVRPFLLPQAGAEPGLEEESPAFAATVEEPRKERTPSWSTSGGGTGGRVAPLVGRLAATR